MEITVKNFKAIQTLENYKVNNLNVLSGTNSGGKTSFIQLLLLLKQSLERSVEQSSLILNQPYVSLGKYKDIIYYNKNNLEIGLKIYKEDIKPIDFNFLRLRNLKKEVLERIESIELKLKFSLVSGRITVENFDATYSFEDGDLWVRGGRKKRSQKYWISFNSPLEFEYLEKFPEIDFDGDEGNVFFEGFFPHSIASTDDFSGFNPFLFGIKRPIKRFFDNITYLGPLRDEPHAYYFNDNDYVPAIGNRGEFAAQILSKHAKDQIKNQRISYSQTDTIIYTQKEESLEEGVRYWICDVFGMAKKIKVNKLHDGAMYIIEVTNHFGLKIPITHVGFGISQVLPIIVEGLRMKTGGILILEQPEIHLHPKVQSLLFDFLYSLTLTGKKVIIETHSDHFITRLRRRVAEDPDNKLANDINLTFIEIENETTCYKRLNLTDYGNLLYWPTDFFDQLDNEYRAIVKAQSRKRKLKFIEEAKHE
ncbi:AAA family ATPase [Desulfosporosinus sp. SB140]|uniref:AAA family ATPase n=1 Tax=Desulfosporosinus paludis TaxID=3115649 RepID=UPI00388D1E10